MVSVVIQVIEIDKDNNDIEEFNYGGHDIQYVDDNSNDNNHDMQQSRQKGGQ